MEDLIPAAVAIFWPSYWGVRGDDGRAEKRPYDRRIMTEPTDAERRAILAELHAQHDWTMPHDSRCPEWDADGCPPNCPFRLAIEAGAQEIIDSLKRE